MQPDAVDSLDWLQHVRMVAKNQIHGAARGHRFSNSSLLCAGLAVILDAPVKTEYDKLGAALSRHATIGDDPVDVDERRPPLLARGDVRAVKAIGVGQMGDRSAIHADDLRNRLRRGPSHS